MLLRLSASFSLLRFTNFHSFFYFRSTLSATSVFAARLCSKSWGHTTSNIATKIFNSRLSSPTSTSTTLSYPPSDSLKSRLLFSRSSPPLPEYRLESSELTASEEVDQPSDSVLKSDSSKTVQSMSPSEVKASDPSLGQPPPRAPNIALLQLKVIQASDQVDQNIAHALTEIDKAVADASRNFPTPFLDLIVLPEVWNGPYLAQDFPKFAEKLPLKVGEEIVEGANCGKSVAAIAEKAKEHGVYIVAGTVPEVEEGEEGGPARYFNTCIAISPTGHVVAKHRKVHLFDIDVKPMPGNPVSGMRFFESETLTGGDADLFFGGTNNDQISSRFRLPLDRNPDGSYPDQSELLASGPLAPVPNTNSPAFIQVALLICYDIRFPEFVQLLARPSDASRPADLLILPGAFNPRTGPKHWHLALRARAMDNQCWVLACAPAGFSPEDSDKPKTGYISYGHSLVVSPWADVVQDMGYGEGRFVGEIGTFWDEIRGVREGIPVWQGQRRRDIYGGGEFKVRNYNVIHEIERAV